MKKPANWSMLAGFVLCLGRGERIRTSGLYVPNVALYQAKLHPAFLEQDLSRSAKVGDFSANLDAALGSAQQKLAGQITHGLGVGIAWQGCQSGNGPQGFGVGRFTCGIQGAGAAHDVQDGLQLLGAAVFNGAAHHSGIVRTGALHGDDQRQGVFAFPQIVAQVFAHFRRSRARRR